MSQELYLVSGALGCIGAWVVRNLIRAGAPTAVLDLSANAHRMKLIMSDEEIAQVRFITGDITDLNFVKRAFEESQATQVIHLAGLQVPFCKADPPLGARVNVVGTVNIFEAAKQAGLKRVVYASSIAVYGPPGDYPAGPIAHEAPHRPRTHYGVYKQANEGTAKIYWYDDGLSSIGLRPYVVYGPGRDQGLTSDPTKAMLAAAAGRPFHIGYAGRFDMQYADDVAQSFIQATRVPFEGAEAFNLRCSIVSMAEIVAAIEAVEASSRGQITFEEIILPFPEEMDGSAISNALGALPHTPLAEGVARTIAIFKEAIAAGRLAV
jgi:nucleoside-diphosphate-sugar epimerase